MEIDKGSAGRKEAKGIGSEISPNGIKPSF